MQQELFPETRPTMGATPEAVENIYNPNDVAPVPRADGWILLGTTSGPRGYHRVASMSQNGSLLTVCGLVGRRVIEDATMIQPCPSCSPS